MLPSGENGRFVYYPKSVMFLFRIKNQASLFIAHFKSGLLNSGYLYCNPLHVQASTGLTGWPYGNLGFENQNKKI